MKITYTEKRFVMNSLAPPWRQWAEDKKYITEDCEYIKTITARIDNQPVLQVDYYRESESRIAAVVQNVAAASDRGHNCNDLNSLAEIYNHMAEVQKLLENNVDTNE